jgi:hypothetical protein
MKTKVDSKTQAILEDDSAPELDHHQRRCTICRHPEREAIEEAFLQWRSINSMMSEFRFPHHSVIYRHAHATGLFARRGRRLRFALDHLIQNADQILPTGDNILRAIRAYSCLDDEGKWHEIPSQVIVSSGLALTRPEAVPVEASLLPSPRLLEAGQSFPDRPLLIANQRETEITATE